MPHRSESVRLPVEPAPFRHPHYETPRASQRLAFLRELEESVRRSDALRARIANTRVLEALQ